MHSLDLLSDWPVDRSAAAVVTRDGGTVASRGDLDEVFPLASVTKPLVAYAALVASRRARASSIELRPGLDGRGRDRSPGLVTNEPGEANYEGGDGTYRAQDGGHRIAC
ncbi:hypothetical protein NJ76_30295, partial [Rhodococcus sp. IITR03]